MRAAMLSDAHARGPDDPSQQDLVAWLDRLDADELFLLGDIFHHWWGYDDVVWAPYVSLCAALERVRARGIDISFVPGNHDFAVGSYLVNELGLHVRGPHVRDIDGVRYFLAHGDEMDERLGYRLVRAGLRSRGLAATMRLLGPSRGHQLLRRLAGASRAHGQAPTRLLEAQRAWAAARLGLDADVAVMGHLHWPQIKEMDGGTMVHLGPWAGHRCWLRVDDGLPTLCQGLGEASPAR